MLVNIESKLLMKALNLLQDYAYEAERDGDAWKYREVALCANQVRNVLFPPMQYKDPTEILIQRCLNGEKTLWGKDANEAYKKMLAEKKPDEWTEFDHKLAIIIKETDETLKRWERKDDE